MTRQTTATLIAAFATLALGAGQAFAAPPAPPAQVPEPGLFGLAALGMGAVILAARLKKRK